MARAVKGRPSSLDYEKARRILEQFFGAAEEAFRDGKPPAVSNGIRRAADRLFASKTQSFREALLGCALARFVDPAVNIRYPYVKHGQGAFNGRTLDERVVNPFLRERMIPCSKGPYLAMFRRSVVFNGDTARGVRDKRGYAAMLHYIGALEAAQGQRLEALTAHLLYRFVELRQTADVPLHQVGRLSLEQLGALLDKLLSHRSGGLLAVLLAVAMFRTIKECFGLPWTIEWQGINVSDRAAGAGGDITVREGGEIVLAVEVTERPVDRSRVIATFQTKILSHGIADYLFLYSASSPAVEARTTARQYFAQGHDIGFLPLHDWLVYSLGTIGPKCRRVFQVEIRKLLGERNVSAELKVAWNDYLRAVLN